MSFAPYTSERDKLDRSINAFATQSFRDQADRDYIAARLACRSELFPQFLWASQQAVEKYLKAILLYNRIKATSVRHDLAEALKLTEKLAFALDLSPASRAFVAHLATYGEYRYIDVPFHIQGYALLDLDFLIWELRRYCQVLNVFGKLLPENEQKLLEEAHLDLKNSSHEHRHKFQLRGGLLERIVAQRTHAARSALLWQNPCFGVRSRTTVRAKNHLHVQNPHLYLYPEMLDELMSLVFIPSKLAGAYREQLAEKQKKNLSKARR